MLARRDVAVKLGCKIYGRILSFAVAVVPPEVLCIGPVFAIPAALKKCSFHIAKINIFEINEAFASQATYCVKALGVTKEKLNPRGCAIAWFTASG